jgi:hypothetical protein
VPPPPQGGYAPQPPTGGGYAAQPSAYAAAVPNEGSALLALILGIVGIIPCCAIVAPVAFFIGNSSIGKIRASNGTLGGLGMAQAGRILGIIGSILFALYILAVVVNIFVGLGSARTSG